MRLTAYLRDETGSSTAEFVLVLPVLLLFIFGLLEFGMLLFTTTQLHAVAEDTARCGSVRVDCQNNSGGNFVTNKALMVAYAQGRYRGLAPAAFVADTNGACSTNSVTNTGRTVAANATFTLNLGVYYKQIPITANACFP